MQIDDKLLEKLRKIKALADEASDTAECHAALLMYQKLLAQNGLDEAEVVFDTEEDETIEELETFEAGRLCEYIRVLHACCAKHFRCMSAHQKTAKGRRLFFVGHAKDALLAKHAFLTALEAGRRLADKRKTENKDYRFNKNQYLLAFAIGFNEALERHEAENELSLVVTTPADVVEYCAGFRKARPFRNSLHAAREAMLGHADGNNVGRGNIIE